MSEEISHFVSLQGVRKTFDHLEVLHGIDLDVGEHNVVCLIGASGSGKSTLLRCINLLEHVDEGTIVVDGQTITGTKIDVNRLRQIGLQDKADEFPDRLSGGQQQRVAIVRALATGPKLMLLDEITSALDPQLIGEVLELVRQLAESGMTMIVATHEMSFAREVANKICFLDAGVIHEEGTPEEILSSPREERTREFLARVLEGGRL